MKILRYAIQDYCANYCFPPLISAAVQSFLKRGYTEVDFRMYVCQLLIHGAPVLLEDIETIYLLWR